MYQKRLYGTFEQSFLRKIATIYTERKTLPCTSHGSLQALLLAFACLFSDTLGLEHRVITR
jgi:hypothetical protein